MTDMRRYAWLALIPVVALAAFFAGRELRPSDAASFDYDRSSATYEPVASQRGVTKAGFSGFGEEAIDGAPLVAGRIRTVGPDAVTVETAGGELLQVRLTGAAPLRRIEPGAADAIRPGMTVVVRPDGDEAAAVLLLAP
jgi:hypothetical protein